MNIIVTHSEGYNSEADIKVSVGCNPHVYESNTSRQSCMATLSHQDGFR